MKIVKSHVNPEVNLDSSLEKRDASQPKAFKFEHIFAAIVVLSVGSSWAALAFLAELVLRKSKAVRLTGQA